MWEVETSHFAADALGLDQAANGTLIVNASSATVDPTDASSLTGLMELDGAFFGPNAEDLAGRFVGRFTDAEAAAIRAIGASFSGGARQ